MLEVEETGWEPSLHFPKTRSSEFWLRKVLENETTVAGMGLWDHPLLKNKNATEQISKTYLALLTDS